MVVVVVVVVVVVELGEALEDGSFLPSGAGRREKNLSELCLPLLEQGHCVPCTTPGTVGPLGLEMKEKMYPTPWGTSSPGRKAECPLPPVFIYGASQSNNSLLLSPWLS